MATPRPALVSKRRPLHNKSENTRIHMCVQTNVHMYKTHTCTDTFLYVLFYMEIYDIYTYMEIYKHVYVHVHIHT